MRRAVIPDCWRIGVLASCASGVFRVGRVMLAVVVTIDAVPGKEEDLISALKGNAEHSREEPSCLKWEWSRHVEDPSKFAIYEVYTDREAFLAHKASEHFAAWVEASTGCIANKVAGQYELSEPDARGY